MYRREPLELDTDKFNINRNQDRFDICKPCTTGNNRWLETSQDRDDDHSVNSYELSIDVNQC